MPVQSTAPTESAEASSPTEPPVQEPSESPAPVDTPVPGLLGSKFADKFTDGDVKTGEPNTSETLSDGTVKTLIYAYSSDKVVLELYHYKKNKLEYQIADILHPGIQEPDPHFRHENISL